MTGRITPAIFGLAAFALAGCSPAGGARPQGVSPLIGLENGQALTFTMTDDAAKLSVLYSDARADIPAPAPEVAGGSQAVERGFRLLRGQPAGPLRFELHGSVMVPDTGRVGLEVVVGGQRFDLTRQLGTGNFRTCVIYQGAEAKLDITWRAVVRQVKGQDVAFVLDGIDIDTQPPEEPQQPCPG